jgi:hypothetical protein
MSKPVDEIKSARERAKNRLLNLSGLVDEIADEFNSTTGLTISAVAFEFSDTSTINGDKQSLVCSVKILHNNA